MNDKISYDGLEKVYQEAISVEEPNLVEFPMQNPAYALGFDFSHKIVDRFRNRTTYIFEVKAQGCALCRYPFLDGPHVPYFDGSWPEGGHEFLQEYDD